MPGRLVFDRKSFLLTWGLAPNEVASAQAFGTDAGFSVLVAADHQELVEKLGLLTHCIGVLVRPLTSESVTQANALAQRCQDQSILCRIFSDDPAVASQWRVSADTKVEDCLERLLQAIFPEKFRELGLFAVKTVMSGMLPDLSDQYEFQSRIIDSDNQGADLIIFCELMADDFSSGLTIRSSYEALRSHSAILRDLDDESVIHYMAEIANQTLGIINYNLAKINLEGRIGLPILIGKEGAPHFRRRSSFYMPSVVVTSQNQAVSFAFHFLVPFLRGANISHDLDFEIQSISDEDGIQVL